MGKTTLVKTVVAQSDYLFFDGDDPTVRALLNQPNTEQIGRILGRCKIVFIDKAQRIEGIGLTLKIITDQFKDVQLLVSGSSSFDLANALNEPLTGRKWEYQMYPVSWEEFEDKVGYLKAEQQLENRLLYGFYPDVLNNPGDERQILKQLVDSYLYKDVLTYANLRKPDVLEKLVRALAFQVGSEVNYTELSQIVGVNKNTIASYIDILEKGYVVFKLESFSRNLRNEIKKNKKVFFFDTGIRNALIGDFNGMDLRQDKGALWENFLIAEGLKPNAYKNSYAKMYFWRTTQQQEVDLVEESEGAISGFEFKWQMNKRVRLPKTFINAYEADSMIVDRSNFRDFVYL